MAYSTAVIKKGRKGREGRRRKRRDGGKRSVEAMEWRVEKKRGRERKRRTVIEDVGKSRNDGETCALKTMR